MTRSPREPISSGKSLTPSYNQQATTHFSTEATTLSDLDLIDILSSLQKGPISSSRFFFSPTDTKHLMGADGDSKSGAGFLKTSVKLPMASVDPYADFKRSMEEMVEAYSIRELPRLLELLHCYLWLNQRTTHKFIILAFVDLLTDLLAQNRALACSLGCCAV